MQRFTLFINFPPNISMIKTKVGEGGCSGKRSRDTAIGVGLLWEKGLRTEVGRREG